MSTNPNPATLPETTLVVRRTFPVTAERLFRAWSDPADLMRWFGPPGLDTPVAEMDFRVGGRYRIGMRRQSDGEMIFVSGTYREITPNARIAFTWSFETHAVGVKDTLVTIDFIEAAGETELVLKHERLPASKERDSHQAGWTGILGKLAAAL